MDGRDQMLKTKVKGAVPEVILPDFPDDDSTATTTVTKSRRVSFGTNFIKEFIVGSAVSAQCASEYEQAFSSSDSSNANSSHSAVESKHFSQDTYVLEEGFKINQIPSEVSKPKISSTICFSTDSPTADMEFTEGCISLAKSILDKKNKEMTVIIQAKPKESKEEMKRIKDDETKYFEGSQLDMSMTKCFRSKENKMEEKKQKKLESEKTRIFNSYDDKMSLTRCGGIWEVVESKENKMPLDVIMQHLDKDTSDVENLFHPEKSLSDVLKENPINSSSESEKLNLNESMDISIDLQECFFKIPQPVTPKKRKEVENGGKLQRLSNSNEFVQKAFLSNKVVIEDVLINEKVMEKGKDSFFESLSCGVNLEKESQDVDMENSMQEELQLKERVYNNNKQSEVSFSTQSKSNLPQNIGDSPKFQSSDTVILETQTQDIAIEPDAFSLSTEIKKPETQIQDMITEPEALSLSAEIRKPVTYSHEISIESDHPLTAKTKEVINTELELSHFLTKNSSEPKKRSETSETSYGKNVDEVEKPSPEKIDQVVNNSGIFTIPKEIAKPEKPVDDFTVSDVFPAAVPEKIIESDICIPEVQHNQVINFNESEVFPSTAGTNKSKELTPEKFRDVLLPEISSPTAGTNDPTLENIMCAAGQLEAQSFTTEEMNELEKQINATDLSNVSSFSGTEDSKREATDTGDVPMHSEDFRPLGVEVQKSEETEAINQSVEIKPSLVDTKVVENLKAQSAEPGCIWVFKNWSFPQNHIKGLLSFEFRLLESLISVKFWLKCSEEKTLTSCSTVSTSEIFLNEGKQVEGPDYKLVVDMGFEKLRKEFEKEREKVRTIRHISYFLDRMSFFILKIRPYLQQIYSILTLYPGSSLKGSVLSFRLYSFPILFSCTVSIDLFDFHRLTRSSLSFDIHFGEFDEKKISDIFEESLKCENSLCEFIIRCTKHIIDIEKKTGYVSKRKHIKLLPPDYTV